MDSASSDLMMWNLIVGFVSATFVIPVIQQPRWSASHRALVTFGYCVIVGVGVAYFTNAFAHLNDARAIITSILATLVTSVAVYRGFSKPTGIAGVIEDATSAGGGPPPQPLTTDRHLP